MRASLLKAYRQTCYEVCGIEIRIGRRSTAMDAMLLSHRSIEAVIITAYNPFSRKKPPGWNQRMQVRLAEATRRRSVLAGKGSWREWSEAHLVVFGVSRSMRPIARRFRQYGIVILRRRQPAHLLIASRLA
jgi:hypothetical protein